MEVQQKLVQVALDTRSNFESTANLYSRLARSTAELGLSQQNLLDLTTTINQSFAVSGATAQEAANAITQLSQGLSAGALRGEEFNSVSEQAPDIMRALAASLNMGVGELKAFAAEGGITAEVVVRALQEASSEIDERFGASIASFGQKMEKANTQIIEWVGTSETVSGAVGILGDSVLELTDNLDLLVDAGIGIAAIYGARLTASLASSAAGIVNNITVTRAHTLALAENQAMEAGRAATMARTTAAEQAAAAQRASIAAQRAAQDRAAIAQDAQRLASTQAALTAERALETQRLQAQISATGRQQSIARLAELRASETAVTNQLTAANQRLTQAEAAEASAKRAATLASVEKARADTAATAAMGAYTTAATAATRANGLLAASGRLAAGAMAMVGGPLGLLVGAGGLLYMFREEIGLVRRAVEPTTQRIDNLTDALNRNSVAAVEAGIVNLSAEYFTLGQRAAAATAQIERLTAAQENDRQGAQARLQNNMRLRDLREELAQVTTEQEAAGKAATQLRETLAGLGETVVPTTNSLTDLDDTTLSLTDSTDKAADKTYTLADAYESLLDRITPNRREARQYARDLGVLNLALASGRMNTTQYMQAMGMLQESFQAAQRETENTANAAEDASQRIANSFLSWETVADNTLRRIDDSGQSLWLGLIDGSESALDTVKRGFQQTLAEIAHMLTTQRLTFHVAGMMGLDTTGMPGRGAGGFNLSSLGSLYSSATKLPYVGDAISGVGSALGFGSSAAAGGTAVSGGFMSAAATQSASSLYGLAATGGAAPVSLMSSITSGISAAMPWLAGGMLVDNVLGLGIVDGIVGGISDIFGGGKSDPLLNISTRGDAGQFSHESVRSGAFGAVGFSEGTKRSNDLFGSVEAEREWLASVAALDNLTAAAARTPEQLDAMTSAVQNMVLTSGDAQGAIDQLAGRTAAATRVIDAELTQTLLDAGASAEQIAQRFATARNAVDLITAASERLNLQYDANADGALRYADSLVQAFGSVENIAAIQDAYYNAAFSDQERLQHQFDDVRGALNGLTDEAPRTVAELRALVEAQQLNGGASQQLAYDLMALAPALAETSAAVRQAIEQQYQDVLGRAPDTSGMDYWFDQVASGAITLEDALWNIANSAEAASVAAIGGADAVRERTQLELQLLRILGDTHALRDYELSQLAESNRPLQQRIWAIEDERAAMQAAERAQQERIRNLERETRAMMSAGGNIRQFVESLQNTAGAGLSPETAYQNAEESFLAAISTIYTSDDNALVQDTINGITGIAQQYLSAAEAYGASGNIYQQAQALVEGSLDDLAGRLGSEELEDIDPQLQAMVDQLKNVATNTGLSGPLAKQVPLAQTFAEFFGGSGSQNYMVRQIGALAEIEKAIRNLEFSSGGGSDIDTSPSQPTGKTLTRSQVTSLVDASDNFSFLKQTMRGDSSQRAFSRSLAGDFNSGSLAPSVARNNVDKLISAVGFDEANYLRLNPDIAEAIGRGEIYSGFQHFLLHGIDEGRQFYNGGYTGPGGKYEPAGIVHRGEVVWSQDDISAWGGVGAVESLRAGPRELPMPSISMPQFPALGQSDVTQVLQDMRREITELRKQNAALLGESNNHLAAANTQRGAAATQQIAATKEGNKMLKKLQDDSRLEAAKR
ncbi:hypothetical protein AWR38_17745 [Idiomarina sp. WRN-38]|nr:hypothetical protein AUR68_17725 [Idiomarina sp. H105]OAE97135.1 hypothetical protein AWR38_17745 [Idiomarina sp. WRN-38]